MGISQNLNYGAYFVKMISLICQTTTSYTCDLDSGVEYLGDGTDTKTFFEHYFLNMCIRFDSCNNNSLAFAVYLSLPNFFIIIQSVHHLVEL